ncbi:uncharacterized protein PHALS_10945 [Plasmopara halstedii]|uniref:Uncharacterized protein n=1 Tax=Plasmopara halstedii TaxID=4781 RepID=A0A0P1AJ09_PLAHL|nr:uncharacterized protein PHALS_10945 [Plasmopara halstedii]CEG40761.1 hypothetical protein PHALS_10945 [Plasmopara halstedii]|eukprot:XP_024577130.1 hypothetical protein PHALS_10945 [Plasmopara halstedii]
MIAVCQPYLPNICKKLSPLCALLMEDKQAPFAICYLFMRRAKKRNKKGAARGHRVTI